MTFLGHRDHIVDSQSRWRVSENFLKEKYEEKCKKNIFLNIRGKTEFISEIIWYSLLLGVTGSAAALSVGEKSVGVYSDNDIRKALEITSK